MRVIGLDPGLRRTGWGVVDVEGVKLRHVANGVATSDAEASLAERLASLFRQLEAVLAEHRPEAAAVEETFMNKDGRATLKLGQARGVALTAPALRGLPVAEYAPSVVKKAVVGVGQAEKTQVQHMVGVLLPGVVLAGPDAADALAVAICHAYQAGAAARLARSGAFRR